MQITLEPPFEATPQEEYCWRAQLPPKLAGEGDRVGDTRRSPWRLFEDERPLQEAHAAHRHIGKFGRGAYSHWSAWQETTNGDGAWVAALYFSTSDNSNPNRNGRRYKLVRDDGIAKPPPGNEETKHTGSISAATAQVISRYEKRWEIVHAVIDEMTRLPIGQSGRFRPEPTGVSVRHYPFPYVAALAVCNDLDRMTREAFEDWHGFVNGRKVTAYGDGLELEIGDSFWVWGLRDSFPCLHRHYPQARPRKDCADLGRMVELGRLGWLDIMHSFTAWNSPQPPLRGLPGPECENPPHLRITRDDLHYALDRLQELGVRPTVFSNHNRAITNIAGEWPWVQHGDEPEHESYCLDLLKAFGFKFFWLDVALDSDKFGDYLDYESPFYLRRAVQRFEWEQWLMSTARDDTGGLIGAMVELPEDASEKRERLTGFFNRTVFKVRAADGSNILVFKRFRGVDVPSAATFPVQVTQDRLDALESMGGAVIIYQHLGSWAPIGCGKPGTRVRPGRPPVFDQHGTTCLREIAERHDAGRLFVATTGRLLEYLWLRENLSFSVDQAPACWVVTLHSIDCDVLGRYPLSPAHFNGLSFLVPEGAPDVIVTVDGRAVPLVLNRRPDPAFPGYHALWRSWHALEWPDQ